MSGEGDGQGWIIIDNYQLLIINSFKIIYFYKCVIYVDELSEVASRRKDGRGRGQQSFRGNRGGDSERGSPRPQQSYQQGDRSGYKLNNI
jgi:hypothetical protein